MNEKFVRKIWQELKSQNGQKFKVLNLIFQGKTTEQIKQNLKIEQSNTVRKNYERLSDDFELPWETPNGSVLRGEKGLRIIGERYQHILRDLDNLYVRRPPLETNCYEAILTPSGFLRIKSPQKMGKTFLVKKILKEVKENKKYRTVDLSLRAEADPKDFDNLKSFFMWLCRTISKKLKLPIQIENDWQDPLSDKLNCTLYFEKYFLSHEQTPFVLCLDDMDRIFENKHQEIYQEFSELLRGWNGNKLDPDWQNFRLIIVHSTEPSFQLPGGSPFNIENVIELPGFNTEQIKELAHNYGITWLTNKHIKLLHDLVEGHPYFVNKALLHLKNSQNNNEDNDSLKIFFKKAPTPEGIYRSDLHKIKLDLDDNPNLKSIFDKVIKADKPIKIDESLADQLYKIGLIKYKDDSVEPTCPLYRDYFRNHLTENS